MRISALYDARDLLGTNGQERLTLHKKRTYSGEGLVGEQGYQHVAVEGMGDSSTVEESRESGGGFH